jgi:hypothetical protein
MSKYWHEKVKNHFSRACELEGLPLDLDSPFKKKSDSGPYKLPSGSK